ncbi:putative Ig domain-containing protein [Palleronia caenipelagi]|uniref:Calcium-binding protein n=1 Tax=Palleronia caenipelagi TaxID=2489174 RepID=A0A547PIF1_9RHOB|nr:putative Ig domain-containing protein [Palleronia caenipelagi]TRD13935.1 calcium-binding protein [Palleronia caenipelagi]
MAEPDTELTVPLQEQSDLLYFDFNLDGVEDIIQIRRSDSVWTGTQFLDIWSVEFWEVGSLSDPGFSHPDDVAILHPVTVEAVKYLASADFNKDLYNDVKRPHDYAQTLTLADDLNSDGYVDLQFSVGFNYEDPLYGSRYEYLTENGIEFAGYILDNGRYQDHTDDFYGDPPHQLSEIIQAFERVISGSVDLDEDGALEKFAVLDFQSRSWGSLYDGDSNIIESWDRQQSANYVELYEFDDQLAIWRDSEEYPNTPVPLAYDNVWGLIPTLIFDSDDPLNVEQVMSTLSRLPGYGTQGFYEGLSSYDWYTAYHDWYTGPGGSVDYDAMFLFANSINANQDPTFQLGMTQALLQDALDSRGGSISVDLDEFITDPDPTGDPLTYSAIDLPAGLILDSSTGVVSGASEETMTTSFMADDGRGGTFTTTVSFSLPGLDGIVDGTAGGDVITTNFVDAYGDTLTFSKVDHKVLGYEGDDYIGIAKGIGIEVSGGAGNDVIRINSATGTASGDGGNDTIHTGVRSMVVDGGTGDDMLIANMCYGAKHTLTGGEGADTFVFTAASTRKMSVATVTDFDPELDTLVIEGEVVDLSRAWLYDFRSITTTAGGDRVLGYGDNDEIVISNLIDVDDLLYQF